MKLIVFIMSVVGCLLCVSLSARDADWFDRRMSELDNVLLLSDEQQKIGALGGFVRIGANGDMDEQQIMIFNRAKLAILAIPGHAKYFQDKIESLRAEAIVNSTKSDDEIRKMQFDGKEVITDVDYEEYCATIAFPTLGLLPSSETVAVLGHFLNDPEGRNGKTLLGKNRMNRGEDFGPRPCNAEEATRAIRKLCIDHSPFECTKPNPYGAVFDGEIDAWQEWWNEIKAGNRTYRFIGSTIEYGSDGPVSTGKHKRQEKPRSTNEPASEVTRSSAVYWIAAILAACGGCLVAVWGIVRSRSKRV